MALADGLDRKTERYLSSLLRSFCAKMKRNKMR